jgi:hypothetical protein
VMPVTRTRCRLAAWTAKLPQPQPTSSTRWPGSRLCAHELELCFLGLFERLRAAREDRAAVGHRAVEKEREEHGGQVIVVAYRARFALAAVSTAARRELHQRGRRQRPDPAGARRRQRQPGAVGQPQWRPLPGVEQADRGVDVVYLELAGPVGAADAKLARGAECMRDGLGRTDPEARHARSAGSLAAGARPKI